MNFLRMFLLGPAKTVNGRENVKKFSAHVSVWACQNFKWTGKCQGIFYVLLGLGETKWK